MMEIFNKFIYVPQGQFWWLALAAQVIVSLCVAAIICAVVFDFMFFDARKDQKQEKRSIVATFSMFLFFFLFYAIIKQSWGVLEINGAAIRLAMIAAGVFAVVAGTAVNIAGRIKLGKNWSNQAKIYSDHKFIGDGVFKLVRHPLYASLIWAFWGASLIWANWLAFLANALVFVPAMYYRAKLEEKMLVSEFPEYKDYQSKVGMFFPKII